MRGRGRGMQEGSKRSEGGVEWPKEKNLVLEKE
jgi:hypothetical protein